MLTHNLISVWHNKSHFRLLTGRHQEISGHHQVPSRTSETDATGSPGIPCGFNLLITSSARIVNIEATAPVVPINDLRVILFEFTFITGAC